MADGGPGRTGADDLARLERAIRRDGVMSTGSMGQPVLHPALTEARQARSTIARLLSNLAPPELEQERPENFFEELAKSTTNGRQHASAN